MLFMKNKKNKDFLIIIFLKIFNKNQIIQTSTAMPAAATIITKNNLATTLSLYLTQGSMKTAKIRNLLILMAEEIT